jgi:hypothetical protein
MMKRFVYGMIAGATGMLLLVILVTAFRFFRERDRKIIEAMEAQYEIEALREDIGSRDSAGFLEDPGVRRAADGAADEFRRKRDEAIQRIRGGRADRGPDGGGGRSD